MQTLGRLKWQQKNLLLLISSDLENESGSIKVKTGKEKKKDKMFHDSLITDHLCACMHACVIKLLIISFFAHAFVCVFHTFCVTYLNCLHPEVWLSPSGYVHSVCRHQPGSRPAPPGPMWPEMPPSLRWNQSRPCMAVTEGSVRPSDISINKGQ